MWKEGKLMGKAGDGQYLKRGESQLGKNPVGMNKDPRRVPLWLHNE